MATTTTNPSDKMLEIRFQGEDERKANVGNNGPLFGNV